MEERKMFKKRVIPQEALKAAKDIIKQVARNNGVSEEEVRAEMKAAMMAGWNNPDPKVRELWSSIPCEGKMPTPEELIIWAAIEVTKNEGTNYPLS